MTVSVVRREPFPLAGTWFDFNAGRARPNRGELQRRWEAMLPRRTGGAVRPIRAESRNVTDVPRAVYPTEEVSHLV